jgi:HmuY protein
MKKLAWILVILVGGCSSDPDAATPVADAGIDEVPNDAGGGARDSGGNVRDAALPQDSGGGETCTAAREQLLKPVDSVSTGEVTVLSNAAGVRTLFVDAAAGGTAGANTNPRLYLHLETATRVSVTDKTATSSTAWDLAIKRPILFANSGDGGPGQGGALLVAKDFDAVTSADAAGATFVPESFFEDDCTPKTDQTGAVKTTFDGWYDYNPATNGLSPHAGTWLVKGATGKLYKVQILSYYATPDGGVGQAGGRYTLKVGAL